MHLTTADRSSIVRNSVTANGREFWTSCCCCFYCFWFLFNQPIFPEIYFNLGPALKDCYSLNFFTGWMTFLWPHQQCLSKYCKRFYEQVTVKLNLGEPAPEMQNLYLAHSITTGIIFALCASCSAVYCNRSCLFVGGCVFVCGGFVTMITWNCVHRSSPNWVYR